MESNKNKLPTNPRTECGILSRILFLWTIPLFRKGFNKTLELEDICEALDVDRSEVLGDRLEK